MTTRSPAAAELAANLAKALFGANMPKMPARAKARRRAALRPAFPRRALEQALDDATEHAAVVGRFVPSEVVQGMDNAVAEAVLSSIAANCDVELHDDTGVWVLGRNQRRSTLG